MADTPSLQETIKNVVGEDGLYPALDAAPRLGPASSDTTQEPTMDESLSRAANHEPFSGTHAHAHPAFDSQGDDATHEHEHTHDNDNSHEHTHTEERSTVQAVDSESFSVYMPITRFDATNREVFGQATVEQPDAYGTIFGYCPDAWQNWRGNLREQHDSKKAVGKAFKVESDPEERAVYVTSRVSRGAQDTWLKIEDGVLSGYSASVIPDAEFGSDTKRWPKKEYNGKQYPYLPRYTVAELSYVDNPATPGCNIQIVRANGFATEVLDVSEEEETVATVEAPAEPLERAGARVSADTKNAMHESIGHTLKAAHSQMNTCGCDACQKAMKQLDPDADGDIDAYGGLYGDTDGDAAEADNTDEDLERTISGIVERVLTQQLTGVYARLQGIAGTLARSNAPAVEQVLTSSINRAFETVDAKLAEHKSSLDGVRTEMSVVKDRVEKIANQPMPGAPVMNANTLSRSADKRLATEPSHQPVAQSALYNAMSQQFAQASAGGSYSNLDTQLEDMGRVLANQPSMPPRR